INFHDIFGAFMNASSPRQRTTHHFALSVLLAASAGPAAASDLSYTYIDFRVLNNSVDASGIQSPIVGKDVMLDAGDGHGISVAGSLALPSGFYLTGAFNSSIIDVDATITSPLAVETVRDEFDLIRSSFGIGYARELAENFDLIFELT